MVPLNIPVIEEYAKYKKSSDLFKAALQEIKITKANAFSSIVIMLFSLMLSFSIVKKENSFDYFLQITDFLFDINLSFFAAVLTVYSIVIAFFSDSIIKRMADIKIEEGKKSTSALIRYTFYFDAVLMLFFISTCISGIALLILKNISPTFLVSDLFFNCKHASGLFAFIYISFSIRIIYEMKSMVYNTVCLFRYSLAYRLSVNGSDKSGLSNDDNEK